MDKVMELAACYWSVARLADLDRKYLKEGYLK
jgi:hypothetical protein